MTGEGLYLYCLTPPSGVEGLAEAQLPTLLGPVHGEVLGGIGAVLSPVAELAEWADESRIASPDWVTPRALHHGRVIEEVWHNAAVYPARFGTLFASRDSLERLIGRHRPGLEDFFAAVTGMGEWGVKVFFDPLRAENQWMAERLRLEADVLDALPAGRRYLAEQRLRREARGGVAKRMESLCRQLAEQLTRQGGGFRERALPPVEEPERRPLGHWAVLWPDHQAAELAELLEETAAAYEPDGIELQWSGPWPPYSFRPALEAEPTLQS